MSSNLNMKITDSSIHNSIVVQDGGTQSIEILKILETHSHDKNFINRIVGDETNKALKYIAKGKINKANEIIKKIVASNLTILENSIKDKLYYAWSLLQIYHNEIDLISIYLENIKSEDLSKTISLVLEIKKTNNFSKDISEMLGLIDSATTYLILLISFENSNLDFIVGNFDTNLKLEEKSKYIVGLSYFNSGKHEKSLDVFTDLYSKYENYEYGLMMYINTSFLLASPLYSESDFNVNLEEIKNELISLQQLEPDFINYNFVLYSIALLVILLFLKDSYLLDYYEEHKVLLKNNDQISNIFF